jgi:hypothetical protein
MKLVLKSMAIAFLVEIASLILMPLLWSSSIGSSNPISRLIGMHQPAIILLTPLFTGSGRGEMPQFILSVVIVQSILYFLIFLAVGYINQMYRMRQNE